MKLSNDYKAKLNILIPFYRNQKLEETKNDKWRQKRFYTDTKTNTLICSTRTYCVLENQKDTVKDEIYEFAVNKLNKRIEEHNEWNQIIKDSTKQLIDAMDRKQDEEAVIIINHLLTQLHDTKDILYYDEVCNLLKALKYFLSDREFVSEKEFYNLDKISDIYKEELYDLLIYYLFVYANYHEDEKIEYVLNKYPYDQSKLISNQRFAVYKFIRKQSYTEAQNLYLKLLSKLNDTKYEIQKLYIYMDLLSILVHYDNPNTIKKYCDIIESLLDITPLTKNQKYIFYNNLATKYLLIEDYEKCLDYLKKAFTYNSSDTVRMLICICFAYTMLNKDIPNQYLSCDDKTKGDNIDLLLYDYFKNFDEETKHAGINYLLKNVLPSLKYNDDLYYEIIEKIIFNYCEENKAYKPLFIFNSMKKDAKTQINHK